MRKPGELETLIIAEERVILDASFIIFEEFIRRLFKTKDANPGVAIRQIVTATRLFSLPNVYLPSAVERYLDISESNVLDILEDKVTEELSQNLATLRNIVNEKLQERSLEALNNAIVELLKVKPHKNSYGIRDEYRAETISLVYSYFKQREVALFTKDNFTANALYSSLRMLFDGLKCDINGRIKLYTLTKNAGWKKEIDTQDSEWTPKRHYPLIYSNENAKRISQTIQNEVRKLSEVGLSSIAL